MLLMRKVLSSMLVLLLLSSSLTCACMVTPTDVVESSHAQHHPASPDAAGCEHTDCSSECNILATAISADTGAALTATDKPRFDNPHFIALGTIAFRLPSKAVPWTHPPPTRKLTTDTPVRRHDRLIE